MFFPSFWWKILSRAAVHTYPIHELGGGFCLYVCTNVQDVLANVAFVQDNGHPWLFEPRIDEHGGMPCPLVFCLFFWVRIKYPRSKNWSVILLVISLLVGGERCCSVPPLCARKFDVQYIHHDGWRFQGCGDSNHGAIPREIKGLSFIEEQNPSGIFTMFPSYNAILRCHL